MKAQARGDAMGNGAFARSTRTVNSNDRRAQDLRGLFDFSTHEYAQQNLKMTYSLAAMARPQRFAKPRKSGKLVATLAQSRITIGPLARRPAMENDIAMR